MSHFRVTGQFADKPNRAQSSRLLGSLWTSQLVEIFDLKLK